MIPVILESPYAPRPGFYDRAVADEYLRDAMRDCLRRGEAPFASHGLYTQPGVLDDSIPEERALGIQAGYAWRSRAEYIVFYTDLHMSAGMQNALNQARAEFREVHMRSLKDWASATRIVEAGQ